MLLDYWPAFAEALVEPPPPVYIPPPSGRIRARTRIHYRLALSGDGCVHAHERHAHTLTLAGTGAIRAHSRLSVDPGAWVAGHEAGEDLTAARLLGDTALALDVFDGLRARGYDRQADDLETDWLLGEWDR